MFVTKLIKSLLFAFTEFYPLLIILLPEELRFYFVAVLLCSLVLFYYFYYQRFNFIQTFRLNNAIGVLIYFCTPIVEFNLVWVVTGWIIYFLFRNLEIVSKLKLWNERTTSLLKFIFAGLITNFLINIFYISWKILPLLTEYYKRAI